MKFIKEEFNGASRSLKEFGRAWSLKERLWGCEMNRNAFLFSDLLKKKKKKKEDTNKKKQMFKVPF